MEYFAFGETFVEEHKNSHNAPWKYNDYREKSFEKAFLEDTARSAELDEETGWYYYGARYYNPRTSIWLSVDPLAEQTMDPYAYAYRNPINLIDPNGMAAQDPRVDCPDCGWFERNITRPIGNFFRGLFGGRKRDNVSQTIISTGPVEVRNEDGEIVMGANDFDTADAIGIVGTATGQLEHGLYKVDPTGLTNLSRLLAMTAEGASYEQLNQFYLDQFGLDTNYSATQDGIMAALFIVPEGGEVIKVAGRYGLKAGKPLSLQSNIPTGTLQKQASKLFKDKNFVKQVDDLLQKVASGNMDPGLGTNWNASHVVKGIHEFRHKKGAGIFFTLTDNVITILGYSNKDKKVQNKVFKAIEKELR